jgi:UTP--glucose-1-phosphate uridylyltransferase
MKLTKAVIPAAGMGTRFLPATKAMPKEMLPVVDKPAIQYVVEEASAAGLDDVLIILGRNKNSIPDHFDRVTELEAILEAKKDQHGLNLVQASTHVADIHYVRQGSPLGLGHAVLRSRQHVGSEPFAVLLGDELIESSSLLLEKMIKVHMQFGSSVVALLEVDSSEIHQYGSVAFEQTEDPYVVKITELVEKPIPGKEPSNFAVVGRYILTPAIFEILETLSAGRGGEIQLTDALQVQVTSSHPNVGVMGVLLDGRRFDTGNKIEYIKSVIELASARDDIGPSLKPWLKNFVEKL